MSKLSCLTCRVCLPTGDEQREHYKGDWHIYNLKRKLNQLSPITKEDFEAVRQKHLQQAQLAAEAAADDGKLLYCEACGKSFANQKAMEQHNTSKKHLQAIEANEENKANNKQFKPKVAAKVVAQVGGDDEADDDDDDDDSSDWEEVDEEEESIPFNECLFCSELSESMEANLQHMSFAHTFFIPEVEYCVDLKGLLNYLGVKIATGRCCLWCSEHGRQFASKKAAQQHMLDKGHTKIKFEQSGESLLEFEDFYDYSSSYPEGEKQGDDDDEEVEPNEITADDDDGFQLRLPSGAVIGHRSLFVYFRQHLKPIDASQGSSSSNRNNNRQLVSSVAKHYKALGWTGLTTQAAVKVAKDIQFLNRIRQRSQLHIGKQNNLAKQGYFRNQLGFK